MNPWKILCLANSYVLATTFFLCISILCTVTAQNRLPSPSAKQESHTNTTSSYHVYALPIWFLDNCLQSVDTIKIQPISTNSIFQDPECCMPGLFKELLALQSILLQSSWRTILTFSSFWYSWVPWLCPYLLWSFFFIINIIRMRKYPGHYWGTPPRAFMEVSPESSNWQRETYPSVGGAFLKGGWMKEEKKHRDEFQNSFLIPSCFLICSDMRIRFLFLQDVLPITMDHALPNRKPEKKPYILF